MSGSWLNISAIDTWMFRDGRPFGQDDPGASRAVSVFPPHPPTVVGALRAAAWRSLGNKWDKVLLGDGVDWQSDATSLGKLSFGPPVVLCNGEPLFPAPLHVVKGKHKGRPKTDLLRPGASQLPSDLGAGRMFPAPRIKGLEGIKPLNDHYVKKSGMEAILHGKPPAENDLIDASVLWQTEERVGIDIDASNRVVKDGLLYMAHHVRPDDRKGVSIAVHVEGWQDDWTEGLAAMGGEHRMAELTALRKIEWPARPQTLNKQRKIILVAISPVVPNADGKIAGLDDVDDLRVVSACTGKPVPIGGWDSHNNRGGLPLRRCWPAGSVWFVKMEKGARLSESIGDATKWGFGRVLAGLWPQ